MSKSFDLLVKEYTDAIVDVINASGMPLAVTKYVLMDILNATQKALTQKVQEEQASIAQKQKENNNGSDGIG